MDISHSISEKTLLFFFLQAAVLLFTARLFGELARRLGQPTVLGEIFAGVVWGAGGFGLFFPSFYHVFFPPDASTYLFLELLSWLGIIFLLFFTGSETDLHVLRSKGKPALKILSSDLLITFSAGAVLGMFLPDSMIGSSGNRGLLSFYLGTALSVTALSVMAKIFIEFDLLQRNLGVTLLGAGMGEDLFAWIALSLLLEMAHLGAFSLSSVGISIGVTGLFLLAAWFIGRPLVRRAFRFIEEKSRLEGRHISLALGLTFLLASFTQWVGIHAVFGAFVAGLLVSQSPYFRKRDSQTLKNLTFGFFSPFFFAFVGMKINLFGDIDFSLFWPVFLVSFSAKLFGTFIGARWARFRVLDSITMGVAMNARGSVEVVISLLALSAGLISNSLFTIVVLSALASTFVMPLFLQFLLRFIPLTKEEEERFRAKAQEARAFFRKDALRFLIPTVGGPNASGILTLAAPLIQNKKARASFLMIRPPSGPSLKEKIMRLIGKDPHTQDLQTEAGFLKDLGTKWNLTLAPKMVTSEVPKDVILDEAAHGYDLLLLGAHSKLHPLSGAILEGVVADSKVPVAVFRAGPKEIEKPFSKILLPTKGGALFPFVFEFALRYLEQTPGASLTVLHVDPLKKKRNWFDWISEPSVDSGAASIIAEAIETHSKTPESPIQVVQKVVEGNKVVDLVLKEARSDGYDLILLGAMKHLIQERLFFGRKVDELTQRAPCSLLVMTPKRGGI